MAATMFAMDGDEIAAALGQLDGAAGPPSDDPAAADAWDDDTPTDGPGQGWGDETPAAGAEAAQAFPVEPLSDTAPHDSAEPAPGASAPVASAAPAASPPANMATTKPSAASAPTATPATSTPAVAPKPSAARNPSPRPADAVTGPTFSPAAVVGRPTGPSTPVSKPRVARSTAAQAPPSTRAADANEGDISSVLLCTADIHEAYTHVDVLSVRAEAASYADAVAALKGALRRGCHDLGGDALLFLRLEREEGGRVVYGTGTVVRRG